MKSHSIFCLECDHEITATLVRDEYGDYLDAPDDCPACGADMNAGNDPIAREDFHSDG